MRTHGTLTEWNEDRGFGFIDSAQGGEKVFVHISAFPRDGQRPRVGELVSFEIEKGPEGKPRAMRVMRPSAQRVGRQAKASGRPKRPARVLSAVWPLIVIAAIGAYMYGRTRDSAPLGAETVTTVAVQPAARPAASSRFSCDGRTACPQMTSCAEAKYFLQHCPSTTMDGDNDGVPCEQQWCNAD